MVSIRMSRILVSGASGPIGSALLPSLKSSGAHVARLTRTNVSHGSANHRSTNDEERIPWDPAQPISPDAVSGFDAVIHLAGESIVGRWTPAKKAKIRESRVAGTQNLAQSLAQAKEKPEIFICSSAIGYYGSRGDEVLKEESSSGTGFLSGVCREWEAATHAAATAGIRTVQLRTGMGPSPTRGAPGKMLLPFKLGVGGKVGDGLH